MNPEPRFAWNGDSTVAHEVVGEGSVDLVYMPGFINNLEVVWDNPLIARFVKRLASFPRLIKIDRRGMVFSDEGRHANRRQHVAHVGMERARLTEGADAVQVAGSNRAREPTETDTFAKRGSRSADQVAVRMC